MQRTIATLVMVMLLIPAISLGQGNGSLSGLFAEGNNAFWNGSYEVAAEKYQGLMALGVDDVAVYYNLGTAMARRGQLGEAVLHYEKTLRLEPGHPDATHNLSVIREYIAKRASRSGRDADLAPAVDPWRAVLDRFSLSLATTLFLIAYFVCVGAMIVRRFLRKSEYGRMTAGVVGGIFFIVALVLGSIAMGRWSLRDRADEGVVLGDEVISVMEGPRSEIQRFILDEGTRVWLINEQGDWRKVRDDQGRDGWIPKGSLGII